VAARQADGREREGEGRERGGEARKKKKRPKISSERTREDKADGATS
jgi:hypothetical protein